MVTVEYQVGASADDGYGINAVWNTDGNLPFGRTSVRYYVYMLFPGVTIPPGATIDAAYLKLYYVSTTGTLGTNTIQIEKAQSPSRVTNLTDYSSRTKCTAAGSWTPTTNAGWNNSGSIKDAIAELCSAYTLNNSNVQIFNFGPASGSGAVTYSSYEIGRAHV